MNKEKNDIMKDFLPFWDKLTPQEINQFEAGSQFVCYKKGTTIHGFADDCLGVLLIKTGLLCAYIISDEGREITLFRMPPGSVCILSAACVINQITFDVYVDAEEDTEALLIRSSVYADITSKNIYAECFTYKIATERFSDVMWVMQQLLFMNFDQRLAIFINDEIVRTGSSHIKTTHEQIAKHIGSAREVVSRMLRRFADDGIVELGRGEILIKDRNKLRNIFL